MYTFNIDISSLPYFNYENDYELIKSFYFDNFQCINEDKDFPLEFKLNLKLEMDVDASIKDIIENLKFSDLIVGSSGKDQYTIALPYWIKFQLDHGKKTIQVSFYVFWMKKRIAEFEEFKNSHVKNVEDIQESLFFSISEDFKNFIEAPDKKVLLNWLLALKEENVIKIGVSVDDIIYGRGDESINKEGELISYDSTTEITEDFEDMGINLLKTRSDRMIEKMKKNYENKSQENYTQLSSKPEDEEEYNKFFKEGGVIGDIITDRGSTFQAHAIPVHSSAEVSKFLTYLKTNNKIKKATHNIMAYRYDSSLGNRTNPPSQSSNKSKKSSSSNKKEDDHSKLNEAFDDDGEDSAGIRLLGILQKMKVMNVLVVVSRWFGGTLLGQDRFKHINDAAKNLILAHKNKFEFL